jgi:hypothetical protein
MMCLHIKNFHIQHYLTQASITLLLLHDHHVNITESWKLKVNRHGTTFRGICLCYTTKESQFAKKNYGMMGVVGLHLGVTTQGWLCL